MQEPFRTARSRAARRENERRDVEDDSANPEAHARAHVLVGTVAATTLVWVAVTCLTRPTDREALTRFCRLVRPAGPGWRHIRDLAGVTSSPDSLPQALLGWAVGCMLVYSALFGAGSFIYGRVGPGVVCAVLFVASAVAMTRLLPAMWKGYEPPTGA